MDSMALYIYSKEVIDVGSITNFPLSMESWLEFDIMFMNATCAEGGGLCNEKTPMSKESFNNPTPMF